VKTTALEPGYPVFLAVTRALIGDRVLLVQAVQSAIAALGALFLYRLAVALTGRWRIGLIAGLLYAAYPLLIRHSADCTDAALMTLLMVAFASEFTTAATSPRVARAGVWLGFAILTRAMALPLLPLGAALHWRKGGWRAAATFSVPALLLIVPFGVRSYMLNGSMLPTRSGLNLFISNSEYTAAVFPDYGPDILQDYAWEMLDGSPLAEPRQSPALERAQDLEWRRLAVEAILRHPLRIAGLKARNVLYFFSPRLVPYHEPTEATRIVLGDDDAFAVENSPPRRVVHQIVYALSYTPVLALAVGGLWLRRRETGRDAILWCVVATFVAAHAVYFPMTRYRVPVEFVLLFYAAVALDRWVGGRTSVASPAPEPAWRAKRYPVGVREGQ
jgi:dolichyl-phosphate-mannose-protein mannosyltransferase